MITKSAWGVAAWFGLVLLLEPICGGELPKLEVVGLEAGERYFSGATISVMGQFQPAFSTHVSVAVFHVLEDGGLIRQASFSFSARENGRFSAGIDPPLRNWLPGRTRLVVTLLPQVKQEIDFEVVGPPVAMPDVTPIYPPAKSDLVVRMPLDGVKVFELPPEVLYLVEGSLRTKERLGVVVGPSVHVETIVTKEDGQRVTHDGATGPSFVQDDGSCWYQLQLKTPPQPGLYHVRLRPIGLEVEGEPFGTSELPFSIRVVLPDDKK